LADVVGDAALTADPENTQALTWHCAAVLTDARLRQSLIERGLAHTARFSWERTARELIGVYQSVAGRTAA
jgi:glycosyltransferase involved in cell wall biosynthesis